MAQACGEVEGEDVPNEVSREIHVRWKKASERNIMITDGMRLEIRGEQEKEDMQSR